MEDEAEKTIAPEGWSKPPVLGDLKKDLLSAQPAHDTQATKIRVWLDNLHVEGTAVVKTPDGSSKVQPKLIRKQAEWRYAALSEPFLNTDDLFKVSPVTWEDEKGATQNRLVLNSQMNTRIDKVDFIDEYVRSCVDEGTAIVRVGWEFQEETVEEDQPVVEFRVNPELGPMHEELHAMMADNPTGYQHDIPKELQMAHEMTMKEGQPIEAVVTGMNRVEVTKTIKNHPILEVCNYKNIILDPSCQGNVDKAGFVIYSFETSKSELIKDGKYTNLESINATNNTVLNTPDHESSSPEDFNFVDDARKKIVAYEYWGYWDYDDSGIAQPFVATWVGDTLIRMEENPYPDKALPFVFVSLLPVRKSAYGEPDGSLLQDNQKIVGAVTRGMIDIMGKSANGQTGHRKDALDATNKRKFIQGKDYEYNGAVDPRMAFHMHTFPEIPNSAQYMLQQQNFDAESMTGVKVFGSGISGDSLGESTGNGRSVLDAASKRETGILRRLAKGMVKIGRKIVAMNAEFLEEEEVVRITNGEFVTIRRDDLAGNYDLRLDISTLEEDNSKAQELAFMLQTIGPNGDPGMTKIILRDIARLRKMPELAHELETFEPQPDPLEEQRQQLEIQKLQMEIAKIQSETQENYSSASLDDAKARTEGSSADQKDLDFVEQESGVTQERAKEKLGTQARGNIALENVKQQTKLSEYLLKNN